MFDAKVIPDDGEPYTIKAGTRDVLVWEKTGKGRSFGEFESNPTMRDVYQIAHIAARRLGKFDGTLAEFETTCEIQVETEDAEDKEEDPTQPDRSPEP